MGAIFGESLTFYQADGSSIPLRVWGDERYARYETPDGYSAVFDAQRGVFCYARLTNGRWDSTGVPVTAQPPRGLTKHLQEEPAARRATVLARNRALLPNPMLSMED